MIFVAPSVYRSLSIRTAVCLQAAMGSTPPGEQMRWQPLWGDAAVARSRSVLMTRFLDDPELEIMVTIDDDIVFKPADFWKIIEGARRTRGVYSGPYLKHQANATLTCTGLNDYEPIAIKPQADPLPMEIRYAAGGFTAIHRDVVEAIVAAEKFEDADFGHRLLRCTKGADEPFIPFYDTFSIVEKNGERAWLSEDYAFCERALQVGARVWLDRSIVLGHMTEHALTTDGRFGPTVGTDILNFAGGFHASSDTGDSLIDSIPADIATFGELDEVEVRSALPHGTGALAVMWERRGEQPEAEWYLREDVGRAYILDLASWHMDAQDAVPMPIAQGLRGKRVLDFGAGIGTFALAAARAGADVTAFEPNLQLRQFTDWRSRRNGIPLTVAGDRSEITGEFDVIVCWHVFEHLEDPVEALGYIMSRLSPGGQLIYQADFTQDEDHPMHHTFDGDWDAFVAERMNARMAVA